VAHCTASMSAIAPAAAILYFSRDVAEVPFPDIWERGRVVLPADQ
jgi:hypothetical protein